MGRPAEDGDPQRPDRRLRAGQDGQRPREDEGAQGRRGRAEQQRTQALRRGWTARSTDMARTYPVYQTGQKSTRMTLSPPPLPTQHTLHIYCMTRDHYFLVDAKGRRRRMFTRTGLCGRKTSSGRPRTVLSTVVMW